MYFLVMNYEKILYLQFLKKELHENLGDHRKILAGSNISFSPFKCSTRN